MKKERFIKVLISGLFAASVFSNILPAAAAVTENECVNAGGSVTEGSGCRFCVGGKLDLEEIKDTGKKSGSPGTETKSHDKNRDRPDQK